MRDDFGPFEGRIWLDCAHQGPLPRVAVDTAQNALEDKRAPHRLADESFFDVPRRLKAALGELIGVSPGEVILGNSTTYGLNLLVQGLPWQEGDEILVTEGDFPTTHLTWLPLEKRGVKIRKVTPARGPLQPEELETALRPETRVFCTSWVFSLAGHAIDLEALRAVCRQQGVLFVVNGSQGIGAQPLNAGRLPIDALTSCGFKWLCGPYATGFCWMRREVTDSLVYEQTYWLHHLGPGYLNTRTGQDDDGGGRSYDVFCTANFLNFVPWTASVRYLLDIGMDRVAAHDQALVERLIQGLQERGWRVLSPLAGPERTALVVFSHPDHTLNTAIHASLRDLGIHVALRAGRLRASPHVYNCEEDIDRLWTRSERPAGTGVVPRRSRETSRCGQPP